MSSAICLAACATHLCWKSLAPDVGALLHAGQLFNGADYRCRTAQAAPFIARGDTVLSAPREAKPTLKRMRQLRRDSVFRIGSITKQFTAAGVLTLVEAGRVGLDDPLSRYLPDFPGGDGISVRQLLNHTSGVRTFSNLPGYADGTIQQDFTTAQTIGLFRDEPVDFAPGSSWAYSNSGYALAGAIIEGSRECRGTSFCGKRSSSHSACAIRATATILTSRASKFTAMHTTEGQSSL